MFLGILISISSFAALPNKVFAPYVDVMLWPTFNLMNCYNATGQKYFTLAFITAGSNGQPHWGGLTPMDQNFMLDQINQLRAAGGDVIISFGGANGTPIDAAITDVNALVNAYQSVINRYNLTWIDFDVEGVWVSHQASIDRRNQAARILQQNNPGLRITYCLPVMPTGLTWDGTNVISKAKTAGVNIYNVNIMAMDYGQSNSQMGQAAISAAQNARSQTQLNIGITPMIGRNDTQNETFTLSNASEVLNFANANSWINMIAMWSCNRDNGGCAGQTAASSTCSGLSQSSFAFINTWKSFSGTTTCTPSTITPYIMINNNGTWLNQSTAAVAAGGSFQLAPHPLNVGTWSWTGPNGFTANTRNFTRSSVTTSMSGNYVARYTNTCGAVTQHTFTITVTGGTFSQTYEAENFVSMSGVITEPCSEGGMNVGSFDAGNWTAYNVNIPAAGTYKVSYRVASPYSGRTLRLERANGTVQLGTISIPQTGGWQTWTSISHNVSLPAGAYSIGIATSTGGFNINRFHITNNLSARSASEVDVELELLSEDEGEVFLFPNPVKDQLYIGGIEDAKQVKVYNMQGMEMISLANPGKAISVQSLTPGFHIAVVEKRDNGIIRKKFYKE